MLKKGLAALAAAFGLLTVPVVAVDAGRPAPVEARNEAPSPVAKTDGRHSKYWVPKGVRKRERSRLTRFVAAVFGTGPASKNRRAVAKAAMYGRGRLVEGFASRGEVLAIRQKFSPEGKLVGAEQTTHRCAERSAKVAWFERKLRDERTKRFGREAVRS